MSLFGALLDTLSLKQIDDLNYEGTSLFIGSPFVYGGQVLAQALLALRKSVDNKYINSMHGYFLEMGNNDIPIRYEITVIREGRSFGVRRVRAWQGDKNIFIMAASFHKKEDGVSHQLAMPNVPSPDVLTPFSDVFMQFAEKFKVKPKGFYSDESPILFHPVEKYNPFAPEKRSARSHVWFKPNGTLPDRTTLHNAFLAYASDFSLLITSLLPHGISFMNTPIKMASLDHAIWFHDKVDANQWHLYAVDSPNSGNSRGFCRGSIFAEDGRLVASVAQEGLIRIYDK